MQLKVLDKPGPGPALFLKPRRTTRVQRLFLLDEHHRASGADGFAVNSTIDLLPDLLDLAKHAEAVAPNRDFASRIIVPPHGYFPQSQSGQLRNIEQLAGLRLREIPVRWDHNPGSKVAVWR